MLLLLLLLLGLLRPTLLSVPSYLTLPGKQQQQQHKPLQLLLLLLLLRAFPLR